MQEFIEQQITRLKGQTYSDNKQYLSDVRKSLEALKTYIVQQFEASLPKERGTKCNDKYGFEIPFAFRQQSDGFNECRSIMLEEINKLKNE